MTDVNVQYFSHLNGLTLGNNWGDLIRLLDTCLVNGLSLTSVTAASIDEQGNVHLTLYAAHKCMLFQVIELSDFVPASLNQKYRIKGVPSTTQLILKPENTIAETTVTTRGTAKLAPLGYDIIFRDSADVKRVYRAKNPTVQHPFIRVDESLASDTGSYTSTYAKSAMVGLIEHMDHIDDYQNPDVLQLPFDPADPAKNWKITGTGTAVVRGWAKWHWATANSFPKANVREIDAVEPATGWGRTFTLVGDKDAFYILQSGGSLWEMKALNGLGLFNSTLDTTIVPNWFLMALLHNGAASSNIGPASFGSVPLADGAIYNPSKFIVNTYNLVDRAAHIAAIHMCPDALTGRSNLFAGTTIPALEVPFRDGANPSKLRGTIKHVHYAGNIISSSVTTPIIADSSMYISDCCALIGSASQGGFYFYLGELE